MSSPNQKPSMRRFVMPILGTLFWFLLTLNIGSIGIQSMRYDGRFTPDSVFYADAGQNIASGRGFSNSMTILYERGLVLPRPTTMWGPLYPLAIAALTFSGLSAPAAALFLSALFGGVLLVGCYVLCRQLYDADVAMVGIAFLMFFQPLLFVMKHAWSETMGLSLGVLSFVVLVQARRSDRRAIVLGLIFAAGLLLGLSIITRYALIPLLPVAVTLLLPRREKNTLTAGGLFTWTGIRALLTKGLVLGAGAGLFIVPVVARSLYYTGRIGTVRGGGVDIDLVDTLLRFLRAVGTALYLPWGLGTIALGVLLCGVLVHGRFYWKSGWRVWCYGVFLDQSRYLLWVWGGGYILFLFYTQTRVRVDTIGDRLLFPGTLFLFLYLVVTLAHLSRWPVVLRASIAIVLLATITFVQAPMAVMVLHARMIAPHDYHARGARIESMQKLAELTSDKDLILAENGMDLSLYLGPRNIVFFRPEHVEREQLTYKKVSGTLRTVGNCERYEQIWLVVQRKEGTRIQLEERFGPFMADLLAQDTQSYPGVALREVAEDALVFELFCEEMHAHEPDQQGEQDGLRPDPK
jgi:hypothetical protein